VTASSKPNARRNDGQIHNAIIHLHLPAFIRKAENSQGCQSKLRGPAVAGLLVCIAYYLGAKLGFALTLPPQPVSVLWPPNSIVLAALLLTPVRWWLFIILAVAPAHWAAQLQSGVPQTMILCWFISNSAEALIGAVTVRWLSRGQFRLDTFHNTGVFVFGGVFLAPFLSSFLDAGFVALNRWGTSTYWEVWRTRFFSNVLTALTLVTAIVSWKEVWTRGIRKVAPRVIMEAALLTLGLVLVTFVVFVREQPGVAARAVLLYIPLPFLLWAAVRFGVAGASAAVLGVTVISIWGTAHGRGPFTSELPLENALSLQIFLIFVSILLLWLAAAMEERQ
jgi:two-component system, LuxR family, sensor kinase FixL